MNTYLVAPHSDDEALFASYIIQRFNPIVYVVTDGYQHQEKFGIPIEQRQEESKEGCRILGCEVRFLHLSDKDLTLQAVVEALPNLQGTVFAPAFEIDGNEQHGIVSVACGEKYKDTVIHYSTYTKDRLYPEGKIAIVPTTTEMGIKASALMQYGSQLKINRSHFEAVIGRNEYLT